MSQTPVLKGNDSVAHHMQFGLQRSCADLVPNTEQAIYQVYIHAPHKMNFKQEDNNEINQRDY